MSQQSSKAALLMLLFTQGTNALLRQNQTNLFDLQEDSMIIRTPQHLEDVQNIFNSTIDAASLAQQNDTAIFSLDENKPVKDHVFFMEDDFNHDVDRLADDKDEIQEEMAEIIQDQANIKKEKQHQINQSEQLKQDSQFKDEDEVFDNVHKAKNNTKSKLDQYHIVDISDNRRPIYGVLTEPLRGDMQTKMDFDKKNQSEESYVSQDETSYIPKSHVQFLEQSGIRVVPISYLDTDEEILELLGQVNGVYMPGDSHKAIVNLRYQHAFSTILNYVKAQNTNDKDYFPIFMMGKSSQVFISQVGKSPNMLKPMHNWSNRNVNIKVLQDFDDTFLLHQLQNDPSSAHAFDMGQFFNKQMTGFRVKDLKNDDRLGKFIIPIATFRDSALADTRLSFANKNGTNYNPDQEFVAIAEHKDMPLYIFTYNIEMTQFIFTDLMKQPDQEELIDKSIPSRHHAQFISHQIADEARINNHKFAVTEKEYSNLIRHHKLATVEYAKEQSRADMKDHHFALPVGLEKHDVYIIEQQKKTKLGGTADKSTEDNLIIQ